MSFERTTKNVGGPHLHLLVFHHTDTYLHESYTERMVNGDSITGSKWTTTTDDTRIYYNTGNVRIGTTNQQTELHINDATTNTTKEL
jgi:hypothetical protein